MPVTSEFSDTFIRGMKARMKVSYHKYGPLVENVRLRDIDSFQRDVKTRIERYLNTGNTEWLMDAANFLMIEFMYPKHPNAHFRATESHESPGVASLTVNEVKSLNEENNL